MAFQNIDHTEISNGKILQILFSKGLTSQMSRDYEDFSNILMSLKAPGASAVDRQYNYYLLKALGPKAVKWQNPGATNRAFPTGSQVTTQEVSAKQKEIQATIELEWNLWDRVRKGEVSYAEPLEVEIQAKLDVVKREMAKALYGDGTGILGTVSSIDTSGDDLVVTLKTGNTDKGFIGWFEVGDEVVCYDPNGSTVADVDNGSTTVSSYFGVVSVDRANNKVTLQPYDSDGNAFNVGTGGSATNEIAASDILYRRVQGTRVNVASIADYGIATEVMAGLESLTADDGRTVFGITMSGLTSGTRQDAGGDLIDRMDIERLMNNLKIRVGVGKYNWNQMVMAYETQSEFIDSKDADRRFNLITDATHGAQVYAYQHRGTTLKCVDSEFCPKNRIHVLPTPKSGEHGESGYAIEFRGTEFENVSVGGQDTFLKAGSAGGYEGMIQQFLNAYAVMIPKHPAACGVIDNFTLNS
jgi:hypothetical protein